MAKDNPAIDVDLDELHKYVNGVKAIKKGAKEDINKLIEFFRVMDTWESDPMDEYRLRISFFIDIIYGEKHNPDDPWKIEHIDTKDEKAEIVHLKREKSGDERQVVLPNKVVEFYLHEIEPGYVRECDADETSDS